MPVTLINLSMRDEEMEALLGIMEAGGFSTPAAAIRCALWKLGKHLDVPMHPATFDQRRELLKSITRKAR